jgi:hypothetical protein
MPSLRVGTWNIAGARREQTNQVDLDAVVAGVRALGVDLLARSGRADQPAVIAQALGGDWFWSYAPALVGDDFRPDGRPEYALDGAAGGLPAGLAGDRTGPHVPEFRPRLSSSTMFCATTRPGSSGPAAPGWPPPPSATTAPWWSSSTSQPPDQAPTGSWPSAPDDRRLARSRSTTASSGPEVGCCPLGETGPAVAVFCRDEDR